jgi:hypothetical protein
MPRWRCQRDKNELGIFNALLGAHRKPFRGRDTDIYALHVAGYGVMLEVKTKDGTLRPIQEKLRDTFPGRYFVVRDVEDALVATGVMPARQAQLIEETCT